MVALNRRFAPARASAGGPVLLREALSTDLRVRQRDQAGAPTNFLEWSLKVPEPKIGRLNFDLFPPQRELYGDEVTNAREVVVMKSTQTGISAWALRCALHSAEDRGDTALYIFPTQTHVTDFSAERVGPAIEASAFLLSRIPEGSVDQVKMKRVGTGWVHFRGSESRAGAQSVAADFVVFDEYDELSPPNLEQIERRTSGATQLGRVPRTRRVGIPRFEGFGIHSRFEKSDQRLWTVECDHCGEELVPDFFKHVRWRCEGDDQDTVRRWGKDDTSLEVAEAWRACHECETPLDVANGRWVAQHPGRRVIGFHLTRMCIPLTDLEEIVRNSRKREAYAIEAFYNNDLGIPHETEDGRLSRQAVRAAQRGYELADGAPPNTEVIRTMGVDVASKRDLTVRISEHYADGRKRALYLGEVRDFADLDPLMARYHVNMAAIDHAPEFKSAQAFQIRHPGRVYIVHFDTADTPPKGTNMADILKADHEQQTASVRRTEVLDTVFEAIRGQRNELPEKLPGNYVDQMRALVRKIELDDKGKGKIKVFYESKGPDDYAFAEAYDTVARALHAFHTAITALENPEQRPLDELIAVQRSKITSEDDPDYVPGPDIEYDAFGERGGFTYDEDEF